MQIALPHPSTRFLRAAAFTPPERREHFSAFTLVEMLVVIGIISLLLVAVIPAVNSLSKSSGRQGAMSNLMTILDQTRSLALADGRNTYVAFVAADVPAAQKAEYSYKAYAVFEDSAAGVSRAIQITKWHKLPVGISFRHETHTLLDPAVAPPIAFPFSPAGGTPSPQIQCSYVEFAPTGAVEQPATTGVLRLAVFEGSNPDATAEIATAKDKAGEPIRDELTIARFTGRTEYVIQ